MHTSLQYLFSPQIQTTGFTFKLLSPWLYMCLNPSVALEWWGDPGIPSGRSSAQWEICKVGILSSTTTQPFPPAGHWGTLGNTHRKFISFLEFQTWHRSWSHAWCHFYYLHWVDKWVAAWMEKHLWKKPFGLTMLHKNIYLCVINEMLILLFY